VIEKFVDNPDWPLPLADGDKVSDEDKAKAQENWKKLCQSKNDKANSKVYIPDDFSGNAPDGDKMDPENIFSGLPSPEKENKSKQYRMETLANFARLMGSEAGRSIVTKLQESPHQLILKPDTSFNFAAVGSKARMSATGKKAVGTGGDLNLVPGAKDTDVALNTKEGNVLFAPRFIAMGHELVHALHAAKGKQR